MLSEFKSEKAQILDFSQTKEQKTKLAEKKLNSILSQTNVSKNLNKKELSESKKVDKILKHYSQKVEKKKAIAQKKENKKLAKKNIVLAQNDFVKR